MKLLTKSKPEINLDLVEFEEETEIEEDWFSITVMVFYRGELIGHAFAYMAMCGRLVVSESTLNKQFQKKGIGKRMYEELIKIAAKHNLAVYPEKVIPFGHTSTKANRVWKSLRKKYVNVGEGVIGVLK
jgi:predicted GNAT family acetyltransferase